MITRAGWPGHRATLVLVDTDIVTGPPGQSGSRESDGRKGKHELPHKRLKILAQEKQTKQEVKLHVT